MSPLGLERACPGVWQRKTLSDGFVGPTPPQHDQGGGESAMDRRRENSSHGTMREQDSVSTLAPLVRQSLSCLDVPAFSGPEELRGQAPTLTGTGGARKLGIALSPAMEKFVPADFPTPGRPADGPGGPRHVVAWELSAVPCSSSAVATLTGTGGARKLGIALTPAMEKFVPADFPTPGRPADGPGGSRETEHGWEILIERHNCHY